MISEVSLPPPLRVGDRVGVAALSGKVDPARLEAGLEALAASGYQPVQAANLRYRRGLFAGSDQERLDAFHQLAGDDTLSAIIFACGLSDLELHSFQSMPSMISGISADKQPPRARANHLQESARGGV